METLAHTRQRGKDSAHLTGFLFPPKKELCRLVESIGLGKYYTTTPTPAPPSPLDGPRTHSLAPGRSEQGEL